MNYFVIQNGTQTGPFNESQLAHLVTTGVIRLETPVWHEGLNNWVAYGEICMEPGEYAKLCAQQQATQQQIHDQFGQFTPRNSEFYYVDPDQELSALNNQLGSETEPPGIPDSLANLETPARKKTVRKTPHFVSDDETILKSPEKKELTDDYNVSLESQELYLKKALTPSWSCEFRTPLARLILLWIATLGLCYLCYETADKMLTTHYYAVKYNTRLASFSDAEFNQLIAPDKPEANYLNRYPWYELKEKVGLAINTKQNKFLQLCLYCLMAGVLIYILIAWLATTFFKNLSPLRATEVSAIPGMVVLGWFIPIVNLFYPLVTMGNIFRGSLPKTRIATMEWFFRFAWVGWVVLLVQRVLFFGNPSIRKSYNFTNNFKFNLARISADNFELAIFAFAGIALFITITFTGISIYQRRKYSLIKAALEQNE